MSARTACVIGWPLSHTRSPAMHNAAYRALGIDATYSAMPMAPDRLNESLRSLRTPFLLGFNVTVPHKQSVMALVDELDATASHCGALNTVVAGSNGRWIGHNTDIEGFARALDTVKGPLPNQRAVVVGSGGAARAVVVELRRRGCEVMAVARRNEAARELIPLGAQVGLWTDLAKLMSGAGLLVDATSIALSADDAQLQADWPVEQLARDSLVCSLVYHRKPALLSRAETCGYRILDGRWMLIHQAACAFTLMTGREAPIDVMADAFDRAA